MNQLDLPLEVFEVIFKFLQDKNDVLQCIQGAKSWRRPATRVFREDVTLNSENQAITFLTTSMEDDSLNYVVKDLFFNFVPTSSFYTQQLPLYMSQFKNVESLRVQQPSTELYATLSTSARQWNYLKSITKPATLSQIDAYHKFASRCHSLQNLRIYDHINIETASQIDMDKHSNLVSKISRFRKLVYLESKTTSNLGFSCIEAILNNCPESLKTFQLSIRRSSNPSANAITTVNNTHSLRHVERVNIGSVMHNSNDLFYLIESSLN